MDTHLQYRLFSVLLLALISSCVAKAETHSHTIEISSLLPASVCTPSTTAGSSKGQSTLPVIHRHGPCSHPTQDKSSATTTPPPLSKILSYDQSRVNSIQSRIKPNPINPNKINQKEANLPANSGQSLGSGNYIVPISLGTPKQTLTLIFDTGSDLTWTQCQPCSGSCYNQTDPIFDPASSSSYSNISCTSPQCSLLSSATGNNPSCTTTNTCIYTIQYGDQSFSLGFFAKETLTITPSDLFPNFLFGCGQFNQGLFGQTAGLLGLARDPISLVSQTEQKYGKYFSYCLPSRPSSTGHLTLGKKINGGDSSNLRFTPFADSKNTSFYFVDIVNIIVGGNQLPISRSVFQRSGTIIDSGTVVTRFPAAAYGALRAAFRREMREYPRAPAFALLDTCFDFSNYTTVRIPAISVEFGGGVEVDLDPTGILVAVNSTTVCLAFAGNEAASEVGILGNTQQKTLEVVYDVGGGRLGFGAAGCD